MEQKRVVLVTGASAGIGKATAAMLAGKGWTVYGTSRSVEAGSAESKDGVQLIRLDVTDPESIAAAVDLILRREGRLDALVNNAGNGIAGALEDISCEEAKYQFEANFFGALSMCRQALPALRQSRGIIVNVSSVAGVLSIPFQALYSASKAALEAMSEALRLEVQPFGVRVSLVEPGDTHTSFTASRKLSGVVSAQYADRLSASVKRMEHDEQNGAPPDAVAAVICRLLEKRNPPVRVAVGFVYKVFLFADRLLPSRLKLWVIGKLYG